MSKIALVFVTIFGMLSSGLGWKPVFNEPIGRKLWDGNSFRSMEIILKDKEQRQSHSATENQVTNKFVLGLKVRAYPEQAVTSLEAGQTIFIIVQDQRLMPVQGAQVSLVIRMPSGEEDRIILPTLTDENGLAQFSFSYATRTIGIVEIKVTVVHEKFQATTSTCFWLWW